MNRLFLDVWHDLKQKRLWPVAVLLGAALMLVPVFLLKGSAPVEEAASPSPTATSGGQPTDALVPGATASGGGASGSSSLDTMPISLENTPRLAASPLDALKSKNPFERPDAARMSAAVADIASGTATVADEAFGTDLSSGLGSSGAPSSSTLSSSPPGGGGGLPSGGSPAGGSAGGGSPSGGSAGGGSATPTPGSGSTSPGRGKVQLYDYRVDLRVGASAGRKVVHRDVARLTPLPSAELPLLVFLGVTDDGSKAVFLVDTASARVSGGECKPAPKQCTFLSVPKESGKNVVKLLDAEGKGYDLEITDIKLERVKRGSDADEPSPGAEGTPAYEPPPPAPAPTDPGGEDGRADEKSGQSSDDSKDGKSEEGDSKNLRRRRVGFLFSELFDLVRAGR